MPPTLAALAASLWLLNCHKTHIFRGSSESGWRAKDARPLSHFADGCSRHRFQRHHGSSGAGEACDHFPSRVWFRHFCTNIYGCIHSADQILQSVQKNKREAWRMWHVEHLQNIYLLLLSLLNFSARRAQAIDFCSLRSTSCLTLTPRQAGIDGRRWRH